MFKKILFATDGSPVCDTAAKTAFELSAKYDSQFILVHVATNSFQQTSPFVQDLAIESRTVSEPAYLERVKAGMKKHYGFLDGKLSDPEYKVVHGDPSREIFKFVKKNKVDCIILGAHADKGQHTGKTLQNIIQHADCPVMSIARPCETGFWYFNQIIFGTNFSKSSMKAFWFAYGLAEYIGCKLHIFHALDIKPCGPKGLCSQKQIENQIRDARAKIEELYVSQMTKFDNYDIAVWEGIPYIEILKFARENSGDLIVMAHHTRESDSGAASLKPEIEQVLLRSACPVISVN